MLYNNWYQEDKHTYKENTNFLKAFAAYVHLKVDNSCFKIDELGQSVIADESVLQIIKCLFEGQTRKSGGLNYLRFLYQSVFATVSLFSIQESISKGTDSFGNFGGFEEKEK